MGRSTQTDRDEWDFATRELAEAALKHANRIWDGEAEGQDEPPKGTVLRTTWEDGEIEETDPNPEAEGNGWTVHSEDFGWMVSTHKEWVCVS